MKNCSVVIAVLLLAVSAHAELLTGPLRYAAELRGTGTTSFGSAFITFDPATNRLTFEVATVAITGEVLVDVHRASGDVSVLHLFEGVSTRASGSGDVFTFATGSLEPSDLAALDNPTSAGGYYINVHTTAFPAGEIRGQLAAAQELDIPVAGHVTNASGQTFVSDVRVFNASSSSPATALLEFFPASSSPNSVAAAAMVVNLPARGTAVLNDVAGGPGFNILTIGAVRISSVASVIATSRVYVNTVAGSFGQFVPAIPHDQALRRGAMPQVSNGAQPTGFPNGFRANVGFFNPNSEPADVTLQLRDASGALLGQNTIEVAALSQQQNSIAVYFPGVSVTNANLTMTFESSQAIFGYVSEVDNVSGDSFLVPAQPDAGIQQL